MPGDLIALFLGRSQRTVLVARGDHLPRRFAMVLLLLTLAGSKPAAVRAASHDRKKTHPLCRSEDGKTLFIAGPPDVLDEEEGWKNIKDPAYAAKLQAQLDALRGKQGSRLWAVSADSGKKLTECRIESVPIYDGMAGARGRLYLAMEDGSVICFGAK